MRGEAMFNSLDCDHNTLDTSGSMPLDSQICAICLEDWATSETSEICINSDIDLDITTPILIMRGN